jgi:hypothetical protein
MPLAAKEASLFMVKAHIDVFAFEISCIKKQTKKGFALD